MKLNKVVAAMIGLSCMGLSTITAVQAAEATSVHVEVNPALQQAVNSEFRQQKNKQRDAFRHPAQTIAFFGIKPEHSVIELWPGGGWYAEILAPYLADNGQYIAANFETQPEEDTRRSRYYASAGKKFEQWVTDNKDVVKNVAFVTLNPPQKSTLGEDNSVDFVLTFRNLHNWAMSDNLESVFASAHAVLKSGGVFGVVEHRANAGMAADSGYMEQDKMVALAEKAGFTLAATSEVNANPKDTKDHPKGVWSLPPRLALEEVDRDKYIAIGESDRMTLKFIKK